MIKYLKKVLDVFPGEIKGSTPSPAADHLFKIRDEAEAKFLPEEQVVAFHHMVAQLLFGTLTLQTMPVKEFVILGSQLCTRVILPNL